MRTPAREIRSEACSLSAEEIIDNLGCSVLVLSPQGRILEANASYYASFGAGARQVLHHGILNISGGMWREAGLEAVLQLSWQAGDAQRTCELPQRPGLRGGRVRCTARRVVNGRASPAILLVLDRIGDRADAGPQASAEFMHGFANSLQILASVVAAAQRKPEAPTIEVLAAIRSHITAIGAFYHLVSQTDGGAEVRADQLLESLAAALRPWMGRASPPNLIAVEAEHVLMSTRQAELVALIVCELASQAVRRAVPHPGARIVLGCRSSAGSTVVELSEEGLGLADPFRDLEGARHVSAFVKELKGDLTSTRRAGGASARISFPGIASRSPLAQPPAAVARARRTNPIRARRLPLGGAAA